LSNPLEELTDIDHYLVGAKLRERISVSKGARQRFELGRFDPKKPDNKEVKEKYEVEISNRFATLDSLDVSFDIRTFRHKKRGYLKGKINELETSNKTKNIRDLYRGIHEFKKEYQPRISIIMDKNGNLLADPHCLE
jgi:hypothetical protein